MTLNQRLPKASRLNGHVYFTSGVPHPCTKRLSRARSRYRRQVLISPSLPLSSLLTGHCDVTGHCHGRHGSPSRGHAVSRGPNFMTPHRLGIHEECSQTADRQPVSLQSKNTTALWRIRARSRVNSSQIKHADAGTGAAVSDEPARHFTERHPSRVTRHDQRGAGWVRSASVCCAAPPFIRLVSRAAVEGCSARLGLDCAELTGEMSTAATGEKSPSPPGLL